MLTARAYLPEGRLGAGLRAVEAEVARLLAAFAAAGATAVEPAALQPAALLLDLYGEEIRARAYVTQDPVAGELMLRPDFTVPVARLHMAHGAAPARYAYAGPVWRAQEPGSPRPAEYLQAGFELFGGDDPAAADAEVFALIRGLVGDAAGDVATGDMGVLIAVVEGLATYPARRAALMRHIWRPMRFRRLLARYGAGHGAETAARAGLVDAVARGAEGVAALIAAAGEHVGRRSPAEIAARVERIGAEAAADPLAPGEVALVEAVLAVEGPMGHALAALRDLGVEAPALLPACDRIAARIDALGARGIAAEGLPFSTRFGRSELEYYDGFVFEISAAGRLDLPPLASGGRYDRLTAQLGGGVPLPAMGAILRPEALVAARLGTGGGR